jgi:hypothetical protein
MSTIKFPKDFIKKPHELQAGAFQWTPKEHLPILVSVIGENSPKTRFGGNGIDTFELLIGNKAFAWQSVDQINDILQIFA